MKFDILRVELVTRKKNYYKIFQVSYSKCDEFVFSGAIANFTQKVVEQTNVGINEVTLMTSISRVCLQLVLYSFIDLG